MNIQTWFVAATYWHVSRHECRRTQWRPNRQAMLQNLK